MKVLREISSKNIPSKLPSGKPANPEYDKLYARILELKNGKVLPVECENKQEMVKLSASIRYRSKGNVKIEKRDNFLYFSLKG